MNLFQIAVCTGTEEYITLIHIIKTVFNYIIIGIPLFLLILGTIDMFKAMTTGDEKKATEARKTIIRRAIYAIVAFLLPFLISLIFGLVANVFGENDSAQNANNTVKDFFACWNEK